MSAIEALADLFGRIVVPDGAMGTTVQGLRLADEACWRDLRAIADIVRASSAMASSRATAPSVPPTRFLLRCSGRNAWSHDQGIL
jgi:hypothetical protein